MNQSVLQAESIPDLILVQRILGGEPRLYEHLIRRYNKRLYRLGMSILNQDSEVEDAMQAAYINAYEHLAAFENRSSFGTWLTRIMLNECLAQKNKKLRTKVMEEKYYQNSTNLSTPSQLLINKELNGMLENAIAALPEKYRTVFVLREVEDLSIRETAEVLSLKETNIKVRLNRAKTMLRENLNGYLKENVYSFHLTRCDRIVDRVFKHLEIGDPQVPVLPSEKQDSV
jgi:RNA polymerase sigma-70 factor (ECF subfamily)